MILYALLIYSDLTVGISSYEMGRLLGLDRQTAWVLCDKIRTFLALAEPEAKLGAQGAKVYVDETQVAIGSKERRVIILAMTDGQRCALRIVPNRRGETLLPLIAEAVEPGSIIVTDGHRSYLRLGEYGFGHSRVNHTRGPQRVWVNKQGDSTNDVETIWAITKRLLKGKATGVSDRNLWKFLAEIAYRYRAAPNPARAWWELIGSFRTVGPEELERVRARIDRRP